LLQSKYTYPLEHERYPNGRQVSNDEMPIL
jgi:hypothetical protein